MVATRIAAPVRPATVRPVTKVVQGKKLRIGGGVNVCRTIGTEKMQHLDPYLMLDELKLPAIEAKAGFPDHPHRGFETCLIMLSGGMEHKDSAGNFGAIGPGGAQWVTTGRGIVHSAMPTDLTGELWGFQLWVNLPKKEKMVKPRYQDYQAEEIPVVKEGGLTVRVIAGDAYGQTGPIFLRVPGVLLDVKLEKGATFEHKIPESWNGFAYICDGSGTISGTDGQREQALVLGQGEVVTASTQNEAGLQFLFVAGQPIGEPIVKDGPFVMNTREEIQQAYRDYESGKMQDPNDDVWAA